MFGSVFGRADGATEFSLSVYSRETSEIVLRRDAGDATDAAEPARSAPPLRFAVGLGGELVVAPEDEIAGAIVVFPLTVRTRYGFTAGVQGSVAVSQDGGAGPIREFRVISGEPGEDVRFTAAPRLHRVFSLELGYAFFSESRFSLTPAMRFTAADYELLFIRTFIDGDPVEPGGHFSRPNVSSYLGGSLALEFAATDRFTLRASASAQRSTSSLRRETTPAFSPTIEYLPPRYLFTAGLGVSVEL